MLRSTLIIIIASIALVPLGALAQSAPPDPLSLQTRDSHEGLTIVADPYLSSSRYKKEIFSKYSPYAAGIVAIDVYFRNDNGLPVRIDPNTIQLVISVPGQDKQRLGILSPDDVADRTLLTGDSDVRERRPFPFPNPTNGPGHKKDWVDMTTALRAVTLSTDLLPPHTTTHGFLFFDMNHEFAAIHYAHLYIPDLVFTKNDQALFFFEIDLAEAPSR